MAKYKFALSPKIRGYVEWQLEHYHEDKAQLEQIKASLMPPVTPSYSQTGGVSKGSTSDPTANAAIKLTTNAYILSTEKSVEAIERTLARLDNADKKLIELVYWRRSHTITGAGMAVGLSPRAAYNRINKLLTLIASEMGVISV